MANNLSAAEVITLQMKRAYIQYGGSAPTNPVYFGGKNANRFKVEGVSQPDAAGGIDPIWMPDARWAKKYDLVGTSASPPELPQGTLIFAEKLGSIPKQLIDLGCFTLYEVAGACADLSDLASGWGNNYVLIYENGRVSGAKDLGNRVPFADSDDMVQDSVPATMEQVYPVGTLYFEQQDAAGIDREVVDVVYAPYSVCDACNPDAATKRAYRVTKSSGAGSPGLPGEVGWTNDGGVTWTEAAITGIGASEDPVAMDIVGDKLVIVSRTAGGALQGGYYWATINKYTGEPGTFTKVIAGFVPDYEPNDIYVLSANAFYLCGDHGYIYYGTDVTQGVSVLDAGEATSENLYRIDGSGDTIVAAGTSSTVIVSQNLGATFVVTTTSISNVPLSITALAVKSATEWWVGTSTSGRLYYTTNGGETWNQQIFSGYGTGDIKDIVWVTPSVGYFAHNTSAPSGRIFATFNGGVNWYNGQSRIQNTIAANYYRRLAYPTAADVGRAANYLLAGGLANGGTDGVLALGVASFF